jgi:hypothetical protein
MPETKRTYEADTLSGLPLHLKKSGENQPKRAQKRPAPAAALPPTDPAQDPDVVTKLIDYLKKL